MVGLLQRDLHVVAQIRAARRAGPAAPAATELAEQVVEDVGEAGGEVEAAGIGAGLVEGGVAEAVVGLALLAVLQDFVGLGGLPEGLLGRRVVGVAVGMVFHRELAIGPLDRFRIGIAANAEDLVIIALSHTASRTRRPDAGRPPASACSRPSAAAL